MKARTGKILCSAIVALGLGGAAAETGCLPSGYPDQNPKPAKVCTVIPDKAAPPRTVCK